MGLHRCGLWSRGQASPASSESRDGSTPAVGTPESPGWERGPRRRGGRAGGILDTHQPRGERDAPKIPEQTLQAAVTSARCVWGVARLFPAQPRRPTAAPSGTWATEAPRQLVARPGAPASRACLFPLGPGLLPASGVRDPQGPLPGGTLRRSGGASAPGGLPRATGGHVSRQAHGALSTPSHPLPCVLILPTLFMSEGGLREGKRVAQGSHSSRVARPTHMPG